MKTQVMNGILTGGETKTLQRESRSSHSKRGTKSCFGTPAPSPLFSFMNYTPWSVQAYYSAGRSFQIPSQSAPQQGSRYELTRSKINNKRGPDNRWRVISAPSCYTYSHIEGNFINGQGCSWTPYYLHVSQSQRMSERETNEKKCLDIKPSPKNISQDCKYLKPTKSWIWSDQPQPQESKRKETFTYLMKSPYLRGHPETSMQCSYQALQYSQKCQAWLKSSL